MTERMDISTYRKMKGKHKYAAKKTIVDGLTFDSKREANRWKKLRLMEKAGAIKDLQRQVPFELNEGGKFSYQYIADFVFIDVESGMLVVEDAKGCVTKEYRKKKKLMKQVYNIEIKEV